MITTGALRAWTSWRPGPLTAIVTLVAILTGMAVMPAAAQADLTADEQAAVQRLNQYFNQLRSLKGQFVQIGPGGHRAKGVFYLKKPGRLRFEYAPPSPLLVVSNGSYVIINNRSNDEADYYPLSQTPLRIVLADNVNLQEEARVLDVNNREGVTSITMEDRSALVPGKLIVSFDDETSELRQWVIIDGNGEKTTISLTELSSGVNPDPGLFDVKIPRKIETGDRR